MQTSEICTRCAAPTRRSASCATSVRCRVFIQRNGLRGISRRKHIQAWTVTAKATGGTESIEERKKEAKEWIEAWRSAGTSSPAPKDVTVSENGSVGPALESTPAAEFVAAKEEASKSDDKSAAEVVAASEQEPAAAAALQPEEAPQAPQEQPVQAASSNGSTSKRGKFSPDHTFEDGTVLFSSDSLAAVGFEEVLSR